MAKRRERLDALPTLDDFDARVQSDPQLAETFGEFRTSRELAARLVAFRRRAGWSQREFAERAGVSQGRIAQLESGIANPSLRTLDRLLRRAGACFTFSIDRMQPSPPASRDQGSEST